MAPGSRWKRSCANGADCMGARIEGLLVSEAGLKMHRRRVHGGRLKTDPERDMCVREGEPGRRQRPRIGRAAERRSELSPREGGRQARSLYGIGFEQRRVRDARRGRCPTIAS